MKSGLAVFFQIAHLFQTGSTDTLHTSFGFEGRHYNLNATGALGENPDGAVALDKSHGFMLIVRLIDVLATAIFKGSETVTFSYPIGDAGYFALTITVQAV